MSYSDSSLEDFFAPHIIVSDDAISIKIQINKLNYLINNLPDTPGKYDKILYMEGIFQGIKELNIEKCICLIICILM